MKLSLSIIVGLLAVVLYLLIAHDIAVKKLRATDSVLSEKTDSIRYWKSRSGKTVAVKSAAEITKSDLKEHYADIAADLKDMKVRLNSVRAVLKAVVEASGHGVPIIIRDTVRLASGTESRDSLFVNDGYLDFRSSISFTEDAGYKYTYYDSILFSLSTERKWFLGKERLIGQVRMSNPNSLATGQTSILIRERQKRFVVSVGLSYDPLRNQSVPALHAGYALFKF